MQKTRLRRTHCDTAPQQTLDHHNDPKAVSDGGASDKCIDNLLAGPETARVCQSGAGRSMS